MMKLSYSQALSRASASHWKLEDCAPNNDVVVKSRDYGVFYVSEGLHLLDPYASYVPHTKSIIHFKRTRNVDWLT